MIQNRVKVRNGYSITATVTIERFARYMKVTHMLNFRCNIISCNTALSFVSAGENIPRLNVISEWNVPHPLTNKSSSYNSWPSRQNLCDKCKFKNRQKGKELKGNNYGFEVKSLVTAFLIFDMYLSMCLRQEMTRPS